MAQKTLLVIVGPTGIGKTSLAVQLAIHFKTEIISADSRQFYKEMNIGTAVPTKEELKMVPHHFVHQISVHENYTAGDFERDAIKKLDELFKYHDIVLMVGGSGLYIDTVVYGIDSFPKTKPGLRQELQKELEEKGLKPLQEELKLQDPDYYQKVDLQNPQRILRAIEVIRSSGKPFSDFLGKAKVKRPFQSVILGLEAPREIVYQRINSRVDQMMKSGLLEEVKTLRNYKHLNALQTVGYREIFSYLEGESDLENAILEIKKNTRRFAKRQGTWFRKNKEIRWIPYNRDLTEHIQFIDQIIENG
ncbi:tRNA (adenosine(37)-N6)-dimethylallyltransferase MiaA [Muriicola soli]|uniref:tRNA dimethylallyltransferase n=1 Tax=Muriicola soli TaxID=2507538 RepID=A0A411E9F7_9FLAO|nr:tRNA (adenosine(37)-N6)-dimethylallyltransferase MiaA [Muriicola soli]QBA64365.1 tRNA (adenosine(37)-N6)-dimethylallyltransferase MiaA [Muriicola soli]